MLILLTSEADFVRGFSVQQSGHPARVPRLGAIERELDELHRVEEGVIAAALATKEPVHRSPSAPSAAVLDLRIADRVSRAADPKPTATLHIYCDAQCSPDRYDAVSRGRARQ
jgi:hypothetical protein